MDRFWSKVERRGDDECWPWLASTANHGYGTFWYEGKTRSAHVVAWVLASGREPVGQIDHTCHNADAACPGGPCQHRACVNPAHLRDVDGATNQQGKRNRCRRGLHAWEVEGVDFDIYGGRWRCLHCRRERAAELASGEREQPRRKTVCKRGHDLLDPENIAVGRDGRRTCRGCKRERYRAQNPSPMTPSESGLKGALARWGTP